MTTISRYGEKFPAIYDKRIFRSETGEICPENE
jgi:hypothetical protein